jgi:hypothetical protein
MIKLLSQKFPKEISIKINEFIPRPIHPTAKILKPLIYKDGDFKNYYDLLERVDRAYELTEYYLPDEIEDAWLYNQMCNNDSDAIFMDLYVKRVVNMYKKGYID